MQYHFDTRHNTHDIYATSTSEVVFWPDVLGRGAFRIDWPLRYLRALTALAMRSWPQYFERADQFIIDYHHSSGVIKLAAIIWSRKNCYELSVRLKFVAVLHHLHLWRWVGDCLQCLCETMTWCARQMRSKPCFAKNSETISWPNAYDTPRMLCIHPRQYISGSDHSRSHNRPWWRNVGEVSYHIACYLPHRGTVVAQGIGTSSGTSAGRCISIIWDMSSRSGDSPPCIQKILSANYKIWVISFIC